MGPYPYAFIDFVAIFEGVTSAETSSLKTPSCDGGADSEITECRKQDSRRKEVFTKKWGITSTFLPILSICFVWNTVSRTQLEEIMLTTKKRKHRKEGAEEFI